MDQDARAYMDDRPERAQTPIDQERERLERSVADLAETVALAEARLQAVLGPSHPNAGAEKLSAVSPGASPLADWIATTSARVDAAAASLREILHRVEV